MHYTGISRKIVVRTSSRPLCRSAMLGYLLGRLAPTVTSLAARLVYDRHGSGLLHISEPFLQKLPQQYGEYLRIGPQMRSCSSNEAAKRRYTLEANFKKRSIRGLYLIINQSHRLSSFHIIQQTLAKRVLLKTCYAKLRRSVSDTYAITSLVQFEPLVGSTTVNLGSSWSNFNSNLQSKPMELVIFNST